MEADIFSTIRIQLRAWSYLDTLPKTWHHFNLSYTDVIKGQVYDIFCYENTASRQKVIAYFHAETKEYKVRLIKGLIEFCLVEFITADIDKFETLLRRYLEKLLMSLTTFSVDNIDPLARASGILTWDSADVLPPSIDGFELFIAPQQPFKINNGSYVVINYVNWSLKSDFTVYYNIYRSEFFAEAHIAGTPDVNYDFDARTVSELASKLKTKLVPRLTEIIKRTKGNTN